MPYQPIEKLLPKAGNSIYRLVRMAANRALELAEGKPVLIKNQSSDKETTTALEEILQGKVEWKVSAKANGKPKKEEKE